jgi:phospholipid/cholesterol/gamma-HCH transport system substrate-binding protein
MTSFDETLAKVDKSFNELEGLLKEINSGQGTLGKLSKDQELYDNLNETSAQLALLLQDFRLNPKRYVNVSVFGKKQKEYEVPEDDPALKD